MGKYYEALKRSTPIRVDETTEYSGSDPRATDRYVTTSATLIPVPVPRDLPSAVARRAPIRRLAERLAPAAAVEDSMRILVSGCRPGDGASTVAAALAIDLSQRLALRTLLLDAHLSRPGLERLFPQANQANLSAAVERALSVRSTGSPRLELGICSLGDGSTKAVFDEFEDYMTEYQAVVVDLGVTRLDARMLPLARPGDPIVLVVRYGHTERHELGTAASALRAANRAPAGVILSGVDFSLPDRLRRLINL